MNSMTTPLLSPSTSSSLDDRKEMTQASTETTYQGATITINPLFAEKAKKIFAKTAWYAAPHVNDLLHHIIVSPEICVSTKRILFWTSSNGGYVTQLALVQPFFECACSREPIFDRTKTSRRADLENQMLAEAEKLHPKHDELLSYMSVGCGGLLQDVVNVGRLLEAGYKKLAVYLVDDNLQPKLLKLFVILMQDYATSKHAAFDIFAFDSIQHLKEKFPDARMHIVSAIDYDEIYKKEAGEAIVEAHSTLAERGRMYLSWQFWNCLFTQKGLEQIVKVDSPLKEKVLLGKPDFIAWRQDIEKVIRANPEKHTVSCAWLRFLGAYSFTPISLFSGLKALGIQTVHVNIVAEKMVWKKDSIEKYLSLCSQGEMHYTVEIFKREQDYFNAVKNGDVHDDLVFAYEVAKPEDFGTIAVCRNLLPASHCYMQGADSALWKYFHKEFVPLYFQQEKDKTRTEVILADFFETNEKK